MKLPSKLPGSLALQAGSSGLFQNAGIHYNYAIGGLPFLSAATRENPIVRETAPVRKDQFDNQTLPGEQSLGNWWYRSQQSFHGGAGQLFADPTQDNPFNAIRFYKSRNVDPWTPGEVSLLNEVVSKSPALPGVTDMTEFNYDDGTPAVFGVTATDQVLVTAAGGVTSADFAASAVANHTVTTDGDKIFVGTLDGIYSAPIPATSAGAFTFTKQYNVAGASHLHMAFVKSRIILAVDNKIYEILPAPGAPPAALPTPLYTHPDTAWKWTGITESSVAIYVVGNNTVRGSIIKFVLQANGTLPTLTGGAIAAQLPSGEVPYSAMGYLGSFVGIGTNKGVRVAVSDADGNLEYGPILFSTDGPVFAWSARDRFLFCTVSRGNDGDSGLYRIDLSFQLADLRFPYATDLVKAGDTGDCVAMAHLGSSDSLVFATAANIHYAVTSNVAASGYLQTSRIRYNTLEPKIYKLVRTRGPSLDGALSFQVVDAAGGMSSAHVYQTGSPPGDSDVSISQPSDPADFISLKFTLARNGSDLTVGAVMWAYQLKALPASPTQRMIQLPLWCFDSEKDNKGQRHGGQGTAWQRLLALEALEESGDTVTLQDFDVGLNVECVVERITFTQTAPPPRHEGWGGLLVVTLRTV